MSLSATEIAQAPKNRTEPAGRTRLTAGWALVALPGMLW